MDSQAFEELKLKIAAEKQRLGELVAEQTVKRDELQKLISESEKKCRELIAQLRRKESAKVHANGNSIRAGMRGTNHAPMRSQISRKLISIEDRDDV